METVRGMVTAFLKREEGRAHAFARVVYESPMTDSVVEAKVGGPFGSAMRVGDWFVAEGTWESRLFRGRHEEHLKARRISPDLPVTRAGVEEMIARTFDRETHGITRASAAALDRKSVV